LSPRRNDTSVGGNGTTTLEMKEFTNNDESAASAAGRPDELTGLTEHLRHTQQQYNQARSPMSPDNPQICPRRAIIIARQKQSQRYNKIDRFFLVLFPLMFLTFNLIYWIAYYYTHPVIEQGEPS
jgi:hypothetical protein